MLVSLGIILVITSVVLFGQNSFNKNLVLIDTAYTIAATVRQSQAYGLSSRRFGAAQNAAYGMHFTTGIVSSYVMFSDVLPVKPGSSQAGKCAGHTVVDTSSLESRPGNCLYDSSTEMVTTYNLNQGFKITNFCGFDTTGTKRCSGSYLDSLAITFLRPNTQASILGMHTGVVVELTSAFIRVTSPDGSQERCVNITKVGQVAVGACP